MDHLQIMSDLVRILISSVFSILFADSELWTKSEQTGFSSETIAVWQNLKNSFIYIYLYNAWI